MILADALSQQFEEIYFDSFYRNIFGTGNLAPWEVPPEDGKFVYSSNKEEGNYYYTGLVLEMLPDVYPSEAGGKPKHKTKTFPIYDDLEILHELAENPIHKDNFIMLSPISYIGYRRLGKNARQMFALCIEIDNLVTLGDKQEGLRFLLLTFEKEMLPRPTYILCSGNGLHLYYVFDKPIRLFPSVVKQMKKLKTDLTKQIWNRRVTVSHDNIQYESIFQAFRMLGAVTKTGERTRAFITGVKVNIEYLNRFVKEKNQVFLNYEAYQRAEGVTPLKTAKEKWPDWYERVPARQKAGEEPIRKTWVCNRGLYDWFLKKIPFEARFNHRYNCLLYLGAYALKCGVPKEEYEADCWALKPVLDFDPEHPFTDKDVQDALASYGKRELINARIETIAGRCGMEIKRSKRYKGNQKLSRSDNMKIRAVRERDLIYPNKEWINRDGRPTEQLTVLNWRDKNPDGTKYRCIKETGLDKKTVYKWWNT